MGVGSGCRQHSDHAGSRAHPGRRYTHRTTGHSAGRLRAPWLLSTGARTLAVNVSIGGKVLVVLLPNDQLRGLTYACGF